MKRSTLNTILALVVVLLLAGVGYAAANRGGSSLFAGTGAIVRDSGDNVSDYSAVFLTNGQVYFGKMYGSEDKVDLRDIYYLQVNQQIQPDQKDAAAASKTDQPNVVLVKLGDELHGPNDRMLINRDQVIFTESLKKDSKVIEAITNYKKK